MRARDIITAIKDYRDARRSNEYGGDGYTLVPPDAAPDASVTYLYEGGAITETAYKTYRQSRTQGLEPIKALQVAARIPFTSGSGGQGNYSASEWLQILVDSGLSYQSERINYETEVGDLANAQLMASAIRWVSKNVWDARLYVAEVDKDGNEKEIVNHPMVVMLNDPNPYYNGSSLMKGLITSRLTRATSYIRKVRNSYGQVIQLWWEPGLNSMGQVCTRPRWPMDGSEAIGYYEVLRNGAWYQVDRDDMIASLDGYNPDTRGGYNGIASLWSEFYTDKHGSHYMANLLRHGLVPPVAIGVGNEKVPGPVGDTWEEMKRDIDKQFRQGAGAKPFKFSGPITVEKLGYDYSSVGMREVRRIPEERFCSVIGISPQSLRLGLGQENSTYNNVEGYTRLDYNDFIKPLQGKLAEDLFDQLLLEFGDTTNLKICWDYSAIGLLQPDTNAEWERIGKAWDDGRMTRGEAREAMGLKFDDEKDLVYKLKSTESLISPDERAAPTPEPVNTGMGNNLDNSIGDQQPAKSLKAIPPQSDIDAADAWWRSTQEPSGAGLINAKAN